MHRLLEEPALAQYEASLGREAVRRVVEQVLDRARFSQESAYAEIVAAAAARLDDARLQVQMPTINATGILTHTDLRPRAART